MPDWDIICIFEILNHYLYCIIKSNPLAQTQNWLRSCSILSACCLRPHSHTLSATCIDFWIASYAICEFNCLSDTPRCSTPPASPVQTNLSVILILKSFLELLFKHIVHCLHWLSQKWDKLRFCTRTVSMMGPHKPLISCSSGIVTIQFDAWGMTADTFKT